MAKKIPQRASDAIAHSKKCARKKTFPTRQAAKQFRRRVEGIFGDASKVYRCVFCGQWHLATKV